MAKSNLIATGLPLPARSSGWLVLLLVLALFASLPGRGALAADPPRTRVPGLPWTESQFTYYAAAQPLEGVLREFARGFSLSAEIGSGLQSLVSGRFDRRSPTEFLDNLAAVHGFQWFVHAGTLYVSRTQEAQVKSIPVPRLEVGGALRRALTELQLLNERFGYTEIAQQQLVVVSGPPAYVRLIEKTLASWPVPTEELQVEVFRLKYASVDDRTILYRDREIRTPGVASILRNLIGETAGTSGGVAVTSVSRGPFSPVSAVNVDTLASREALAPSSSGGAAAGNSGAGAGAAASNASPSPVSTSTRASIQADSRLNALIVKDVAARMPIYRALIPQLDVRSPMIEIEAMIVDVNKNKLEELGISWYLSGNEGRGAAAFGSINLVPGAGTLSLFGGPSGSRVDLSGSSVVLPDAGRFFLSRVRALEQTGDASIQARPSILTAENLGAVLDLSETFYIETTSERTAIVTPVTAGTSLRVTPRLVREGERQFVRLNVDIEDGQIQANNPVGNIPTVRRGSVSTEAMLSLESSLLIGGYSSTQTVAGQDKVPLLGDIPLIGSLFSTTSQQVQQRERLFMIRARLVDETRVAAEPPAPAPRAPESPAPAPAEPR